jgi:predicted small lipoprotein YifL
MLCKIVTAFAVCLALAGCGADGPPQAPSPSSTQTGLTISGDAQIGVVSK